MKKGLCGILIAAQSMGTWLTVAQTDTRSPNQSEPSAIEVNVAPVRVSTGSTNSSVAVYPRSLDFPPVGVGGSSTRSFTVQNVGVGTLTGTARGSGPFRVVGGSPYVVGRLQSHVITVQYAPKAAGLDVSVIRLTGGSIASITVAGSAVPAPASPTPPARPTPPSGLRLLAGGVSR